MIRLPLAEVARETGAVAPPGAEAIAVTGLAIDSRDVAPGDLFVALSGERTDGHRFLSAAREAGASAALVTRAVDDGLPQLAVADAVLAMGRLARAWRRRFRLPVVAVTGSNGKTTVKAMVSAILAARGPCLATRGNYNNELGLPLTVARLGDEHRSAVLEMGCGKPGDIRYLADIGAPSVGVITNASAAHIERLGSVAGVAQVKGELVSALPQDGIAVLNRDDAHFPTWASLAGARQVISFGSDARAEVRASYDRGVTHLATAAWTRTVTLPLPGAHNALNAAAASAAALALEVDAETIVAGLATFTPPAGRLARRPQAAGWVLLEDSYNANPASLEAGIRVLVAEAGEPWLVLGDMAELGPEAPALHRAAGVRARELGVARLYAVGPLARHAVEGFGPAGRWFADQATLVAALGRDLAPGTVCLIKGSRSARMEAVAQALGGEGAACS